MNNDLKLNLRNLLENDLQNAEIILAAQDVVSRLQEIAEDVAKIGAQNVLPLSDTMTPVFGHEKASNFENVANKSVQDIMNSIRKAKEQINVAISALEGKEPVNDMSNFDTNDADDIGDTEDKFDDIDSLEGDQDNVDFDIDDSAPLGRVKKESIFVGEKELLERKLMDFMIMEASLRLPPPDAKRFSTILKNNMEKNPKKTSEWIRNKLDNATMSQLAVPSLAPSASDLNESELDQHVAKMSLAVFKIAKQIRENVKNTGKGNTKIVIEKITKSLQINESNNSDIFSIFGQIFGTTPQLFAMKLIKEQQNMSMMDKAKLSSAAGKLAVGMTRNRTYSNKPINTAKNDLDPEERRAIDKLSRDKKKDGVDIKNVSDAVNALSNIDENINEPHWPVNTMGQYKGEPFQTDYGLYKPKMDPDFSKSLNKKPKKTEKPSNKPSQNDRTADVKTTNDKPLSELDGEKDGGPFDKTPEDSKQKKF